MKRGPRKIVDFVGNASAPRRECGVGRREPVCRATGVCQMKRGPRKIVDFAGKIKSTHGLRHGCFLENQQNIKSAPDQGAFGFSGAALR